MSLTSPSLLLYSSKELIWKKRISNVIMFGKISPMLYLGGKKEILGPIPATHLDLCQKCFITIYNNDSVDIFKVL